MPKPRLTIRGLQEAMDRNEERIAAMKPSGKFGEVMKKATTEGYRYAVSITHVDIGALRASHRMKLDELKGTVFIHPSARNPRSRQLTSVYGPEEHARGGEHAFYTRTRVEAGPKITKRAQAEMTKELTRGS